MPDADQRVMLTEKLQEYLSLNYYMETYIFPSFALPFKIDEYNTITDLKVIRDTVVNTIIHDSNYPPENSEPYVSNIKNFMCDRWSWMLRDERQVSYNFVDPNNEDILTISIGRDDCNVK